MAYYDTYRDQLANLYHGHALWVPDPAGLYDRVRVGDVGYVRQGHFIRLFNALVPYNDTAQVYGVPDGFVPLNMGPFHNTRTRILYQGDYCSNTVTVDHGAECEAPDLDETTSASFRCRGNKGGAFLSLPFSGVSEDAIRTKAFETYIRKHCDSWLEFAILNNHDARLEDLILVTGCDLTSSWAMAAFVDPSYPNIRLGVHVSAERARFRWFNANQPHNNEPNQNVVKSHCTFLRGFRAKRILPFFKQLMAAAGPGPDDPDKSPDSSIEPIRRNYRDPLIGILDFIAEQCPDQEIAIAHEDDLKLIKGVDVLTADAVQSFLRRNKIPLRTEHGAALLAGEEDEVVLEDQKLTFFALANASVRGPLTSPGEHVASSFSLESEPIPLVVHVVLEDLLKLDIVSQTPDYGFGLPTEDLLSSAIHPPVLTLILEHKQGYPQKIEVLASDKGSRAGATVEDVLRTVGAHLQLSSTHRERPRIQVGKSRPPSRIGREPKTRGRRIEYLSGRNRLQIFPLRPLLEEHGITHPLPSNCAS